MTSRILVAGIGNIFLCDDGFGVEVVRRLAGADLPDGVTVADYGIRGMHLAYDLANGFDAAILVDATGRGAVSRGAFNHGAQHHETPRRSRLFT
jgi:hydrogenase maturation protease